ncbi:MAG: anhydro-N-acetylmuramic acid kinase [Candidatus Zixiibacteriota bacterium]
MNKKTLVMLGLNSGTSADGLDMTAVRISRIKRQPVITYLASSARPFPWKLQEMILSVADSEKVDLDTVVHLDNLLGQFFGLAASVYIKRLAKVHIKVDAVATHGQTVRHLPEKKRCGRFCVNGTLQLGSLDHIAAYTGKITVGNFRQADIAVGGEGAPITVGAMNRLFARPSESRLIVNLGGIANYFYFPAQKAKLLTQAADCGPGNSLSDTLSKQLFSKRYDRYGQKASKGNASTRLLSLLMAEPFFSSKTASTGREIFGAKMARKMIAHGKEFGLSAEDLLATAIELTAMSIAAKVQTIANNDKNLSKLYLTGGGRKNTFLVNRLKNHLPGMEIRQGDELGIDADFIEAAAYAVMGEACLRSEPLNTGDNVRKSIACILGRIVQPPVSIGKRSIKSVKLR